MPAAKPAPSPDDDVFLGRYASAPRTYLGEHRRGVVDGHPDAAKTHGIISEPHSAKFFLGQGISRPVPTAQDFSFFKNDVIAKSLFLAESS